MSDPLSITASVTGVSLFSLKLATTIRDVVDAPETAQKLSSTLEEVGFVLRTLKQSDPNIESETAIRRPLMALAQAVRKVDRRIPMTGG